MVNSRTKPKIYVRKAKSSDKEAVFNFCRKTWSWGDYIPKVWDKWLKEKNSIVFVATINKVPVGISHLTIDKPSEVWLSGARTDPNYRRMGVATAITKKCLKYAQVKGAKIARLVTESNNKAAQRVLQKLGFQPITEFVEAKTENITKEVSENSRWAEVKDINSAWAYLQNSEVYRESAGLYTVLFHWYSLEKEDLEKFVKQRKVILHENSKGVDGLVLIDNASSREWREKSLQTCYIDGDYTAALDMLKFLKNHCYTIGIQKIYAFTCNYKPIVKALDKLGFEIDEPTEIVYAKKLV
ncbi:hypothetical protein DRO44_00175 [Candidatus Bathyarchaeota archaeon]|nr:MAG: hypothetical protein DRO44_00175 [Candidatus Bathyarchaeota archaeon]